eukprot:scaffold444031_cov29-Prasinocladus_malaysianus.AAC.1
MCPSLHKLAKLAKWTNSKYPISAAMLKEMECKSYVGMHMMEHWDHWGASRAQSARLCQKPPWLSNIAHVITCQARNWRPAGSEGKDSKVLPADLIVVL